MMDACCDEDTSDVTFMTSAQVGKTEIVQNILGYHIDQDPCPLMIVFPTKEMGQAYSKDRLDPMIRDTEPLTRKVAPEGSRKKDNTVLHKVFIGGHVTISGANSPASLSSRPIRIVLCDDVDRFPYSAGEEGDPEQLAFKRTQTFYNKKRIDTSTPTIRGLSRIEQRYKAGNMQKHFVPCHKCDHVQELIWKQVKFKNSKGKRVEPYYECESCGAHWNEIQKRKNIARAESVKGGGWIATNPDGAPGHQSFYIWELYSPWSTMSEIVDAFYDAKKSPLTLQAFVNTVLAESWEEGGETLSSNKLFNRRGKYPTDQDGERLVPKEVLVLIAGVDIQKTWIEGEVVGFGRAEQCWGIDPFKIVGDTEGDDVWLELAEKLEQTYRHASGHLLKIACVGIDSGHLTDTVYRFCEERSQRRVWAMKGSSRDAVPIVGAPTKKKTSLVNHPVDLYMVGTNQAKSSIYARLRLSIPGPGYCHFHEDYNEQFFEGLTAEKALTVYTKGFPKMVWRKPPGIANEPLDIRVYQYAALLILNPVWKALENRLESEPPQEPRAKPAKAKKRKAKKKRRRRPGFVGGFS
jgi:phage terminase large subunit GpA-like protein